MPVWLWFVDSFGLIVLGLVLLVLGLSVRRRFLARGGSTFDLSVNTRRGTSARGWTLGVGRYSDTELQWFRTFSFAWRPRHRFRRGHVEVVNRREPVGAEAYALHAGHTVAECRTDAGPVQLGLSPQSLTGLLAWLESAPPGRDSSRVI
ncbi:MAG: DUF2550 domain-containing protein [Nocardioidaceae bacterium]